MASKLTVLLESMALKWALAKTKEDADNIINDMAGKIERGEYDKEKD